MVERDQGKAVQIQTLGAMAHPADLVVAEVVHVMVVAEVVDILVVDLVAAVVEVMRLV
jgi:hypothetical protein